jgi:hypothetical protein
MVELRHFNTILLLQTHKNNKPKKVIISQVPKELKFREESSMFK